MEVVSDFEKTVGTGSAKAANPECHLFKKTLDRIYNIVSLIVCKIDNNASVICGWNVFG